MYYEDRVADDGEELQVVEDFCKHLKEKEKSLVIISSFRPIQNVTHLEHHVVVSVYHLVLKPVRATRHYVLVITLVKRHHRGSEGDVQSEDDANDLDAVLAAVNEVAIEYVFVRGGRQTTVVKNVQQVRQVAVQVTDDGQLAPVRDCEKRRPRLERNSINIYVTKRAGPMCLVVPIQKRRAETDYTTQLLLGKY